MSENSLAPDHLVITAATSNQANGYRAQLEQRRRFGQLPASVHTHVVYDPPNCRVGSGGSTFLALYHLARALPQVNSLAETFAGQRVFILHAGGLSTRLLPYAAIGKLFTPLPCSTREGQPAALFDLLLANLQKIPRPQNGHILIASGDVLLTFNASEIDTSRPGITGVCYPDNLDRAAKHGVYVVGADARVLNFLQKPTEADLRRFNALDASGRALIDTGLMSLDPTTAADLLQAGGVSTTVTGPLTPSGLLHDIATGAAGEIDLYQEIALALATGISAPDYRERVLALPRNSDPSKRQLLERLFNALHGIPFQATTLSHCDFFHLGTNQELLAGLIGKSRTSVTYGFHQGAHSVQSSLVANLPFGTANIGANNPFVFNSVLEGAACSAGPATVVEGGHCRCPLILAGRNILTGLPAQATEAINLPKETGMFFLPVGPRDDWAAVIYGFEDTFQSLPGGQIFLNGPVEDFLAHQRISPDLLWTTENRSLYEARLWSAGPVNAAIRLAQAMLDPQAHLGELPEWRNRPRFSIADLIRQVDFPRLLAQRGNLLRLVAIHRPFDQLVASPDLDAARMIRQVETLAEAADMMTNLAEGNDSESNPSLRARVITAAHLLHGHAALLPADPKARVLFDQAARRLTRSDLKDNSFTRAILTAVAEAVAMHVSVPRHQPQVHLDHDQVIWVTSPARLDFAGGWSDTPPICTDRGGAVVNAAVTLNGQYPIQAIVKLNTDYTINLTSIDLGQRLTLDAAEPVRTYSDLGDWSSLPKACLCLSGLIGPNDPGALGPLLRRFGGGLDLTLFSALPKGSGLGVSSILGAAVLSGLARLLGEALSPEELIRRTALLEQIMTTGGGWQDQIGGALPGVKLIRTNPGPDQTPSISWLSFDDSLFHPRLLLFYTGQKRLAKNILQNVVLKYLARAPEVLDTIDELKSAALDLRECIDNRDIAGFAQGVSRYWRLKKRLDPGASTPLIDAVLSQIQKDCDAYTLLGAGGGGFLLLVAKNDSEAVRRIRVTLTGHPSVRGARFFDFAIDQQGLKVCVL